MNYTEKINLNIVLKKNEIKCIYVYLRFFATKIAGAETFAETLAGAALQHVELQQINNISRTFKECENLKMLTIALAFSQSFTLRLK